MCAKYLGDAGQLGLKYESGTYAFASGTENWIGQVQDDKLEEEENITDIRYLGIGTRNVDSFRRAAREIKGTFSYYPQDWKMLGYALGSVVDAGSPSPYTHALEEMNSNTQWAYTSGPDNPFASFTLVSTKEAPGTGNNFVRTVQGAMVDSFKIKASQNDVIECEVGYVAKDVAYSSGAKVSIVKATTEPFVYSDVLLSMPSGTTITELKEVEFSIKNNIEVPFYLNGSRVTTTPMPTNRDYELSCTIDMTDTNCDAFYNQYYLGGSEFNTTLMVSRSAGSRDCIISLSGCRVKKMEIPDPSEGVTEVSLTVQPKTCSALVNDAVYKYNLW